MASEKHNDLIYRAGAWLANRITLRGYRGYPEICLNNQYVADFVAIASFQSRFYEQYLELAKKKPLRFANGHWVGVGTEWLNVFEAKYTRSDFISTFNDSAKHANRKTPSGSMHWLVCKKGICHSNEVPEFWGILETYGNGLREIKKPIHQYIEPSYLYRIAYRILWSGDSYRKSLFNEILRLREIIESVKPELITEGKVKDEQ